MRNKTDKKYRVITVSSFLISAIVFSAIIFVCFFSLKVQASFKLIIDYRRGDFVDFPIEFKDMEILFFTISIGLTAAFFTVLSIFLSSRQKLSLGAFFYYTANIVERFLLFLYFFNILFIILLPCFSLRKYTAFYYVIYSIIEFLVLFGVAFERILCLESPKKCAKLLAKICKSESKNNNYRISTDSDKFYSEFLTPAFADNTFAVFSELYKLETKGKLERDFDFNLLDYLLSFSELKDDSIIVLNGLKTVRFYIADLFYKSKFQNEEDIKCLENYVDLFFRFYRQLFYMNSITYPYIFECTVYFRDFYAHNNLFEVSKKFSSEIARIFKKALKYSKEMIVFSLHYCTEVDIHSHIKDFMNSVQLIEISNLLESREILIVYQKNFIDIVTHIINMIQMQRLNNDMLIYVYRALNNINEIRIFDDSAELYYEILPRTDFHTIVYSRNYYIVLLLILCKFKNDELYKKTFRKLRYKTNNSKDSNNIYELINSQFELLKEDDLLLISENKSIIESYNQVKLEIQNELERRKNTEIQNIFNTDFEEQLFKASNVIIAELKSDLSWIYREKTLSDNSGFLSITYEFSGKSLRDDSYKNNKMPCGYITTYIYESLFSHYINNIPNTYQIKSFSEIKGLENETRIFVSRNCFDLLFNDKEILFNGTSFMYNDKSIDVFFVNSEKQVIILGSDFEKEFEIIDFHAFVKQAQKHIEEDDVILSVLFKVYLDIFNNSSCKLYSFM